jgi:hypothetical protein
MSVNLSPLGGVAAQFFNNDGVPLAGGLIYTYLAGTNTSQATYTTISGLIAHSNPIVLDSAGRVPTGEIWLTNGVSYKFIIKDSSGALIGTYDNLTGLNALNLNVQNFTGDGSTVNFTLSNTPANENNTFVYINGVYQNKNTYSLSASVIGFSEAPPITSKIEVMYYL